MANKTELALGQHVRFLRSHNKAVSLTGTIVAISEAEPIVDVKLDDHDPEWIETAHVDDVTVLDPKDLAVAAGLQKEGINATATDKGIVVKVPSDSFVKVNNKPNG